MESDNPSFCLGGKDECRLTILGPLLLQGFSSALGNGQRVLQDCEQGIPQDATVVCAKELRQLLPKCTTKMSVPVTGPTVKPGIPNYQQQRHLFDRDARQ